MCTIVVTRALDSDSSLPTTDSMRQQGGCVHRLPRLAHSWKRAVVSRVKKTGHQSLFVDIRKSQANHPNITKYFPEALD